MIWHSVQKKPLFVTAKGNNFVVSCSSDFCVLVDYNFLVVMGISFPNAHLPNKDLLWGESDTCPNFLLLCCSFSARFIHKMTTNYVLETCLMTIACIIAQDSYSLVYEDLSLKKKRQYKFYHRLG